MHWEGLRRNRRLRLPRCVFASSHSSEAMLFKFEDGWMEGFNLSLSRSRDKDVGGHAGTTIYRQALQLRRLCIDGTDSYRPDTREQVDIHFVEVTRKEDGILNVAFPRSGAATFPIFRVPELAGAKSHIGTRIGNFVAVALCLHASTEPLCEPVGDDRYHVVPHHYRRRELRIVLWEAVSVLHEEMVDVRQHLRSHILVSAFLERGLD